MSVRHSLLAILDQGACYGYQVRREYERRTGAVRPLNAGQIFNTLERLERDGLVTRGPADDAGHVYWSITPHGSAEAAVWLARPVALGGTLTELAQKVSLAASLPGVDVSVLLRAQRAAAAAQADRVSPDAADELALTLANDAARVQIDAMLAWLDAAEQAIAARPAHAVAHELDARRPRRGRPGKADPLVVG